ncbi:unnamed protein product, partial [Menidia menidia]
GIKKPTLTVLPTSKEEGQQSGVSLVCVSNGGFPSTWTLGWKVGGSSMSSGVSDSLEVLGGDGLYSRSSTLSLSAEHWRRAGSVSCEATLSGQSPVIQSLEPDHCSERFLYSRLMSLYHCGTLLVEEPNSSLTLSGGSATLACLLTGYSPQGAVVSWEVDGTQVTEGVLTSPEEEKGGRYGSSSTLSLSRESWTKGELFSCRVLHHEHRQVQSLRRSQLCSAGYPPEFGEGTKLTVLGETIAKEDSLKDKKDHDVTPPKVKVFPPSKAECKNQKDKNTRKKTLLCVATKFYPDHVSVVWNINGIEPEVGVATDSAAVRDGKFYKITSRLRVPAEVWFDPQNQFSCTVKFFDGKDYISVTDSIYGVTEVYLKITQNAKLSYVVFIVKSCVYGAFVCFLVWTFQEANAFIFSEKKVWAVVEEEESKWGVKPAEEQRAAAELRMWSQSSLQLLLRAEKPPRRNLPLHHNLRLSSRTCMCAATPTQTHKHAARVFMMDYDVDDTFSTGSSMSNKVHQTPADALHRPGEAAVINCSHSINSYDRIFWYKQMKNQIHLLGYMNSHLGFPEKGVKAAITGSSSKGRVCTITVEDLEVNSSAVYFCVADYHSSSFSNLVHQVPGNIHSTSGGTAQIYCIHTIPNYNQILWYKQSGKQLLFLGYMHYKDGYPEAGQSVKMDGGATTGQKCILTVEGLSLSSSAVYYCAAKFHTGSYHSSSKQKPAFHDSSLNDHVDQSPVHILKNPGESATINCSHWIQGYNRILWYKQIDQGQLQFLGHMFVDIWNPEDGADVTVEGNADKGKTCTLKTGPLAPNSSVLFLCAASLHNATYFLSSSQKPPHLLLCVTAQGAFAPVSSFSRQIQVEQFPLDVIERTTSTIQLYCTQSLKDHRVMLWYMQTPEDTALTLIGFAYGEFGTNSVEEPFRKHFKLFGNLKEDLKNGTLSIENPNPLKHTGTYFCATRIAHRVKHPYALNKNPSYGLLSSYFQRQVEEWPPPTTAKHIQVKQFPLDVIERTTSTIQLYCTQSLKDHRVMLWYMQTPEDTALRLIGFAYGEFETNSVEEPFRKHFKLFGNLKEDLKNGTLSIENPNPLKHTGTYFCATRIAHRVKHPYALNKNPSYGLLSYSPAYFGRGTKVTVLDSNINITEPTVKILRPAQKEIRNKRDDAEKKTLVCAATRFYPDHVSIYWQINGEDATDGVATDHAPVQGNDSFYTITSRLRVPAQKWFSSKTKFTCAVRFFNGSAYNWSNKTISGDNVGYMRLTQNAKLSYTVIIVKSCIYGAFVCFLVLKL